MQKLFCKICDNCRKVIDPMLSLLPPGTKAVLKNGKEFCSQSCADEGRELTYLCGHSAIVGWAIPDHRIETRICRRKQCRIDAQSSS